MRILADDIVRALLDVHIAKCPDKWGSPNLKGISVKQSEDVIRVCATDGKILIEQQMPADDRRVPDLILPLDKELPRMVKRVDRVNKALKRKGAALVAVSLEVDDGRARWVSSDGQSTVWMQTISGKYPAYEKYLDRFEPVARRAIGLNSIYLAMVNKVAATNRFSWRWQFGACAIVGEPFDSESQDRKTRVLIMRVQIDEESDAVIPAERFDEIAKSLSDSK